MDTKTFISQVKTAKTEKETLEKEWVLSVLRKEIYEFLISRESEDEFYDFFKKTDIFKEQIPEICKEIEEAGWKWKLGFGDTGLFIFQNEVPITCWG